MNVSAAAAHKESPPEHNVNQQGGAAVIAAPGTPGGNVSLDESSKDTLPKMPEQRQETHPILGSIIINADQPLMHIGYNQFTDFIEIGSSNHRTIYTAKL